MGGPAFLDTFFFVADFFLGRPWIEQVANAKKSAPGRVSKDAH
jgi:hypothetical protein